VATSFSRLRGWLNRRRRHGAISFLDVKNQMGQTQVVADSSVLSHEDVVTLNRLPLESGLSLLGAWRTFNGVQEFRVMQVESTYPASMTTARPSVATPKPLVAGMAIDQTLKERHLQIRNPITVAALKARHRVHSFIADWLRNEGYVEIHAPILTQLPLYEDKTAIGISVHGQDLFLTQCVGYYLEAAVHGLERVYNIGPSFRAEDSKSPRHLVEYWHVKVEAAWFDINNIIEFSERLVTAASEYVVTHCRDLAADMKTNLTPVPSRPFDQISYREVIRQVRRAGGDVKFGDHIGPREEALLWEFSDRPFWVVGNPRSLEPFPYRIDPCDPEVTITADLVIPAGYGELLGVAEKITDEDELTERMLEKHKDPDGMYRWLVDIRRYGCVPHCGMGMGFERLLRWLFQARHVRDFVAFPRIFGRPYWP